MPGQALFNLNEGNELAAEIALGSQWLCASYLVLSAFCFLLSAFCFLLSAFCFLLWLETRIALQVLKLAEFLRTQVQPNYKAQSTKHPALPSFIRSEGTR